MGRFNAMTGDMRPLFEGIRLVGTAITVKTIASDLAAAFKAIDVCKPGDVVVIDSHGSINTAFWGENMTMSPLTAGSLPPSSMVLAVTSRKSDGSASRSFVKELFRTWAQLRVTGTSTSRSSAQVWRCRPAT
jgi:Aldolase/RraA